MPKDFIKKYLPDPEKFRSNKSLHFLGDLLHDPNLWHLNRHSVARAFMLGLFWGCIPMPFQMVASAICAVRFNANLPLSVGLVWFSNPLTMPPIFYFEYLVGTWLLNMPTRPFQYELSVEWFLDRLYEVGFPLLVGSLVCGVILSITGYFTIHFLWKKSIEKKWSERRQNRKLAKSQRTKSESH